MISLETEITVDSLERDILRIGKSEADDLRIPTTLHARTLGNQAALTQFIITWARRQKRPTLITYENQLTSRTETAPGLFETVHGLAAGLLAKGIEAKELAGDPLQQLVTSAYRRFTSVDVKGHHLCLVVSDSHPFRPKTAAFLHLAPEDFAERAAHREVFISDFRVHLNRCFTAAGATPFSDEDSRRVVETIYELFANTEEWATADISGDAFTGGREVRGILAEIIPIKVISERLGVNKNVWLPLTRYLSQLLGNQDIAATHVLELSIFDSGVGLAQRHLKRAIDDAISVDTEYAAIIQCLQKNGTSSSSALRGLGLYRVMQLLTHLKGFLRLRTGRLGLFRDFLDDPYLLDEAWARETLQRSFYRGFEYLWDWDLDPERVRTDPRSSMTKTKRAAVDGTLFTLWVPLRVHGLQLPLL